MMAGGAGVIPSLVPVLIEAIVDLPMIKAPEIYEEKHVGEEISIPAEIMAQETFMDRIQIIVLHLIPTVSGTIHRKILIMVRTILVTAETMALTMVDTLLMMPAGIMTRIMEVMKVRLN